jgi:arginyl-tRNA--protein-N-Asp/Glu arginylyltransferase
MLHRIDGELAFVGVLDYTNMGMSSVYLFYDPKWEFLSPGTLAALREIEHIRISPRPELHWYYMGLYYQDCQKSVYKANFKPS